MNLLAGGLAAALLAPAAPHPPGPGVVFHIADSRVTEASSLADFGGLMVTANDSGHSPLLFVLDARTGRTVGTVRYASAVTDVEALAPAARHRVWVGDIGDNPGVRDTISVYRVRVGRGTRTVDAPLFRLAYPDGHHDAEALVARRGRLYVITKSVLGGAVYAAPRALSPRGVNPLHRIAAAPAVVTDAALMPDGRHLLLRNYGWATVERFPQMTPVAAFRLPHQRQGEAISVGPRGRVRITSEGLHPAVVQVAVPAPDRDGPQAASASATESASATASAGPTAGPPADPSSDPGHRPHPQPGHGSPWPLAVLALVVLGASIGLRRLRRRLVRHDDDA